MVKMKLNMVGHDYIIAKQKDEKRWKAFFKALKENYQVHQDPGVRVK